MNKDGRREEDKRRMSLRRRRRSVGREGRHTY
jgi:hypothetical protein